MLDPTCTSVKIEATYLTVLTPTCNEQRHCTAQRAADAFSRQSSPRRRHDPRRAPARAHPTHYSLSKVRSHAPRARRRPMRREAGFCVACALCGYHMALSLVIRGSIPVVCMRSPSPRTHRSSVSQSNCHIQHCNEEDGCNRSLSSPQPIHGHARSVMVRQLFGADGFGSCSSGSPIERLRARTISSISSSNGVLKSSNVVSSASRSLTTHLRVQSAKVADSTLSSQSSKRQRTL